MKPKELIDLCKLYYKFRRTIFTDERYEHVAIRIELEANFAMESCRDMETVKSWEKFLKYAKKNQIKNKKEINESKN